jgi:isoleucyl-tRNA synthetase
LRGLTFGHPFLERTLPAVLADYVTLEQGSGIVHTAPGHGVEDFETGQQYGLEIYCPVDASGRFTDGPFRGDTIWDANPKIIGLLRQRGNLMRGDGRIEHSYPHCWRCHQPLLFRATEQWFIRLAHRRLRERALEEIKKVQWIPAWGEERITDMISIRPDWCISRQRLWGVPIPIFSCETCGTQFLDVPTLRTVVRYFKREGADAWFAHAAEELLPQGTRCENCGGTGFRKETDILDVWFDSGCSHLAVLTGGAERRWPADAYIEGMDQYRGWFHSSLLVAVGVKDQAPYQTVVTYGWVLDAQGRPMSKSLGNVIAPSEVWEKFGAEVLRLLTASVDYHGDLWVSSQLLEQTAEAYRKVRNTFRYCLSNLYDFDPRRDSVPVEKMEELDRWMLDRASELAAACLEAYADYAFHRVWHRIYNFSVVDLSALYLDILKDRLYTFAPASPARRSAQTALYRIAHVLARLVAPILCFTAEEVWDHLPATAGGRAEADRTESVHGTLFPAPEELAGGLRASERQAWDGLLEVRNEVLKALERARQAKTIRSSLEAQVGLRAQGDLADLLKRYEGELAALFIVSHGQVHLSPFLGGAQSDPWADLAPSDLAGLQIAIRPADGKKCERCWNFSPAVGRFDSHPTVCERCVGVLETLPGAHR